MKKPRKHKKKAEHNENFYNAIKDQEFSDWAATGLFYAAIHYIEGYLATKRINVGSHKERLNYIIRESQLKGLYVHYRYLYDTSVNARYKFSQITNRELKELYQKDFLPIKSHLSTLY